MSAASRRVLLASSFFALGIAATLFVGYGRAAGIPTTGTLTYSGMLALPDGTGVTGSKNVALVVYDAATAGKLVCQVMSAPVAMAAGRFQIALPDACVTAVKANSDLWVEIQVDGASVGRTKLGAVPYAVEAGHADSATNAANATNATTASALRSVTVSATPPASGQVLVFDGNQWLPFEFRWGMMHAAASGACAAVSPQGDSGSGHIVLPRPAGVSCTAHCTANADGYTKCRSAIAVGNLRLTQATSNNQVVGWNYNYSCDDAQNSYDEVKNQGLDASYTQYCCCYR